VNVIGGSGSASQSARPSASPSAGQPDLKAIPAPPDVAKPPDDAERTSTGLTTKVLEKGEGTNHPKPTDKVKIHYTGWTRDGTMFGTSRQQPTPLLLNLPGVIKGWREGLMLMVEGESRRMWVPAELAYGDKPPPGSPSGDLVFDVQLLGIVAGAEPPETPKDLKAPAADATRTKSGLAYKVLKRGEGTQKPTLESRVTVHYSGWTSDGRMFDSTVTSGSPTTFALSEVIKGWQEALPLMVPGQKNRLWIPADLAYGDKPERAGQPAGALVFDVELVAIQ
jgi:peptidylprolyl isomerase